VGLVVLVAALMLVAGLVLLRGGGTSEPELPRAGRLNVVPAVNDEVVAGGEQVPVTYAVRFGRGAASARARLEQREGDRWRGIAQVTLSADGTATVATDEASGPSRQSPVRAVLLENGSASARTNLVQPRDWLEVFADDFDGDRLDASKWAPRQPGSYNESGSRACSKSDTRAISVSDGILELRAMLDPDRLEETCRTEHGRLRYYLNGHVGTEGLFEIDHGFAAARIRFPRERGQHGAFWLQRSGAVAQEAGAARGGAEIDVVEYFGEGYPRGGLASFIHYIDSNGEAQKVGGLQPKAAQALKPGDDWWSSFHVFSVEWTAQEYVVRVDDHEIFRTGRGVSGVQQFLVLSLLTSDWELPDLDESTLPSAMEVDWVRVWQPRDVES
jgi:beta-glucanase (GH16 family)